MAETKRRFSSSASQRLWYRRTRLVIPIILFKTIIVFVLAHVYSDRLKTVRLQNLFRKRHLPQSCKSLLKTPRPFHLQSCWGYDQSTSTCRDGVFRMTSQHFQDYYLYTKHFKHLKRPGRYLEVAANDPVTFSNTWFMDQCLQWSGICVEANPIYIQRLEQKRSCTVVHDCVSDQDGRQVQFVMNKLIGGIKKTHKYGEDGIDGPVSNLTCLSLATVLKEKERVFDYFSLDVEGHELQVLQGIDWNEVRFGIITVEVSNVTEKQITSLLLEHGYLKQRFRKLDFGNDIVYINKRMRFGHPNTKFWCIDNTNGMSCILFQLVGYKCRVFQDDGFRSFYDY